MVVVTDVVEPEVDPVGCVKVVEATRNTIILCSLHY